MNSNRSSSVSVSRSSSFSFSFLGRKGVEDEDEDDNEDEDEDGFGQVLSHGGSGFSNQGWAGVRWLLVAVLAVGTSQWVGPAVRATEGGETDLLQLSLEDLGSIKITTVSRKSESLTGAAAAIHVITQDEIRRMGINVLPEALRFTPGLEVARANSRQWAITSRGFNGTFANKLLVLMDGRTLYTPLFSGVFWELTDTVLEDLDRIEVIRGPGATQWGANAVNGVINFISKSAKDTQGLLVSGGGGVEERGFGTVRYGGQLASNVFYRVYGKYSDRDDFTLTGGGMGADSWWTAQEGFRIDWEMAGRNRLTLQGDHYNADLGGQVRRLSLSPPKLFPDPFRSRSEGGNVLGRWTHEYSEGSELTLQTFYDRTDHGLSLAVEARDTIDVDAQHRFQIGERHEIVWGGGYRYSVDDIRGGPEFSIDDPRVGLQFFSAFVQDEVTLTPDRLRLTFGTKIEHNDFTGFELQPNARLAWTPEARQTLWASVSRAVRTPSRTERGAMFYSLPSRQLPVLPFPALFPVTGSSDFQSEKLIAYELGYRVQPHARLSVEWTAFYNDYEDLRDAKPGFAEVRLSPANVPYVVLPLTANNSLKGETYGTEVSAAWQPRDSWRLRAGYSLLRLSLDNPSFKPSPGEADGAASPQQQAFLWSDLDLGRQVEWGLGLRWVDRLPLQGIRAYAELDARLAWKPSPTCELAVIGRHLLDPHHREFAPNSITIPNVEVDRAVYVKLTLRF